MKKYQFILFLSATLITGLHCNQKQQTPAKDVISIDTEQARQTIEGFGSCLINYKKFPDEYNDSAFISMVVNDLGLSILRIPLMEHTEYKNDNDNPDVFNWQNYYLANNINRQGLQKSMQLLSEFKKHGVKRFMATPWSPPEFMKTNKSPIQGGYLRADKTREYAEYMAAQIILAKKNWGIDINWVTVQNELLFTEFYRSCLYHPQMLREAIRALSRKFKKEGITTKILMPEDMMYPDRMLCYITPTMQDPETKNYNGHFATHRKAGKKGLKLWTDSTRQYNRQNWMTETSGHEQTWNGALKLASDIYEYLVFGNFNAWIYWQLSEKEKSGKYSILIDGKPTPKYYASKHYYKFIRPGAIRVETNTSNPMLQVSAFKHQVDGTLSIVIVNPSDSTFKVTPEIKNSALPEKISVYQSTENKKLVELTSFQENNPLLNIPPKSITTIYGTSAELQTKKQLPPLPESWQIPADADTGTWGNTAPFPRKKSFQMKADAGNISMIGKLKKTAAKQEINYKRHNGWTMLHLALLHGDGDAVNELIKQGADINATANNGWRPIHAAAACFVNNHHKENRIKDYNKYQVFKTLLDAKPKVNVTTTDGLTPLHVAVMNAYTGWRQDPQLPLKRINDLVDAGCDVNAQDNQGRTPLHWAALQGYFLFTGLPEVKPDVIQTLIKANANINATDFSGKTPLHYASEMGYNEIVFALIQAGAETSVNDNQNKTPTDLANERELYAISYILENKKLPPNLQTKKTDKKNSTDNEELKYGKELLHAAWNGNINKVKELLNKGADINYVDTDGFRAIDRARDNGHTKIVKLLEDAEKHKNK